MATLPAALPFLICLCSCGASGTQATEPNGTCTRPTQSLPAPGGDLGCPSGTELATIEEDIPIAFEGTTATGALVCSEAQGSRNLTEPQLRTYQALIWMSRARFDAPLPWTSLSLYDWFRSIVVGIAVRSDLPNSYCCDPPGVIHIQMNTGTAIPPSSIPSFPLVVMVHEARHIEVGGHTCGTTSDQTIDELGAFGVQYKLLTWIATHQPSATAAEREWALNSAAWLRYTAFCRECQ